MVRIHAALRLLPTLAIFLWIAPPWFGRSLCDWACAYVGPRVLMKIDMGQYIYHKDDRRYSNVARRRRRCPRTRKNLGHRTRKEGQKGTLWEKFMLSWVVLELSVLCFCLRWGTSHRLLVRVDAVEGRVVRVTA